MFQDIEPKVLHNEYVNKKPNKDDFVLFSTGEKILIKLVDEKLTVPTIAECDGFGEFRYLLAVDDRGYYGIEPKDADEFVKAMGEKSFNLEDKFIVRGKTPEDVAFALATCFILRRFMRRISSAVSVVRDISTATRSARLYVLLADKRFILGLIPQ